MLRLARIPHACLALLAFAAPWVASLGAAAHLVIDHGHAHEHSRVLATLEHGHEHASGTPDHDHAGLPSLRSALTVGGALCAALPAPAPSIDQRVEGHLRTSDEHPPPPRPCLFPGDLLRI